MSDLLTPKEAARTLKISERQLRRLKIRKVYIGRLPRYRPEVIAAYVDKAEKRGKAA